MKASKKLAAALNRRIKSYEAIRSGPKYPHISDSPNRNQMMHKPGSQNRNKGCSV